MFDTIQEIAENKFLSNLITLANSHRLYGAYIKYTKAKNPLYNGMYFVVSLSAKNVTDKSNNIEELYRKQLSSNTFNMNLHITKISNQSPFNVYMDVSNYCLHASSLRGILNYFGYEKNFEYISIGTVTLLEMFYLNSIDSNLKLNVRDKYFRVGQEFLKEMGEIEIAYKGQNPDKARVHMAPEKLDKRCPNMVSMEELLYRTLSVEKITVTLKMLPKIKEELNKRPEILYFQSKPCVSKLKLPNDEGFGSKEGNTFDGVEMLYDAFYSKDIDLIYLRTKYPEIFRYSMAGIKSKSKTNDVCYVGISIADIKRVFDKAYERGLPICLDIDRLYYSCDPNSYPEKNIAGYAVAIPNDEKCIHDMDELLTSIAVLEPKVRILSKSDMERYSYFRG